MASPALARLGVLGVVLSFWCAPGARGQGQWYSDAKIEEVWEVSVVDGRLMMDLKLEPTGFSGRLTVRGPRGEGEARLRSGQLTLTRMGHEHGTPRAADLSVSWRTFGVRMEYNVRGSNPFTARYWQFDSRQSDSDGSWVVLTVPSEEGGGKTVDFKAPDYATLCREHPKEAALYLAPMFRALKASPVFGVNPTFARFVLVEPAAAEALAGKVKPLVAKLDSDDRKTRVSASAELELLGPGVREALGALDRSAWSAQQHAEVEGFLNNLPAPTPEMAATLRADRDFVVDCLYCSDPTIREAAVKRLGEMVEGPVKIDPAANPRTLSKAIEALREAPGKKEEKRE